jgi:hypothetical protein
MLFATADKAAMKINSVGTSPSAFLVTHDFNMFDKRRLYILFTCFSTDVESISRLIRRVEECEDGLLDSQCSETLPCHSLNCTAQFRMYK